ncbi:MAG: PilZ domain-containing protein [Clostridia bacterium]|nr:PilZ domain-containing protein [Clostridia bacterium]
MSVLDKKRRLTRADFDFDCRIEHDDSYINCKIINFSLTGFLILAEDPNFFEVGSKVSVFLDDLMDDSTSKVSCEIVRIEGKKLGLKFYAIDYDTLMKLKDLLAHLINDGAKVDNDLIRFLEGN